MFQEPKWIVLVQRTARGPLSVAEVKALLSEGVIRHNDIGVQVETDNHRVNSGWKLLWQFPEFDRRLAQNQAAPASAQPAEATSTPKVFPHKRISMSADQIQRRIQAELTRSEGTEIVSSDLSPRARLKFPRGLTFLFLSCLCAWGLTKARPLHIIDDSFVSHSAPQTPTVEAPKKTPMDTRPRLEKLESAPRVVAYAGSPPSAVRSQPPVTDSRDKTREDSLAPEIGRSDEHTEPSQRLPPLIAYSLHDDEGGEDPQPSIEEEPAP